jgi:hypothetical protein
MPLGVKVFRPMWRPDEDQAGADDDGDWEKGTGQVLVPAAYDYPALSLLTLRAAVRS